MPADENAPFRRLVSVAAAHNVNPDGRFAIHAVVDALQPVIEPSQMERIEIQRRIVRELGFSRVSIVLAAMNPRPDNQPLEALLGPAQLDKIQIRDLRSPGIVPAGGVVFGNVFILRQMIDDAGAGVFPELVIVSMAHRLDQPGFVIGGEFQRRRSRAERQTADIFSNAIRPYRRGHGRRPGSMRHGTAAGPASGEPAE